MVHKRYTNSVKMVYMDAGSEFVRLLNEEMKRRNMGVRQAAAAIGTSHPTLIRALAGEKVSFEFAVQLSQFLRIPPDQVFRLAGLLPPVLERTEQTDRLLYLFNQLDPDKKQDLLGYAEFLTLKK